MSNSNHVHRVVPHNESWAIMDGNSSVPAYIFPDKLSAIKKAQELAEDDDGEVIIKEPEAQKTNGTPPPPKPQPRREQFTEPEKKGPDLEVKSHAKGWAVYGQDKNQPIFIYKLKAEAIYKAEQLAHRYKSEVVLHGKAEMPEV